MLKKPRQRRGDPAPAANDNKPGAKPSLHNAWDIYGSAARARWVGQVIKK